MPLRLLVIKLDVCLESRVRPDDRGSGNLFQRRSCDTLLTCDCLGSSWSSSLGSCGESVLLCTFGVRFLQAVLVRCRVGYRSFLAGFET